MRPFEGGQAMSSYRRENFDMPICTSISDKVLGNVRSNGAAGD